MTAEVAVDRVRAQKISAFTIVRGKRGDAAPSTIVYVPPQGDMDAGFAKARLLLATAPVRLVGPGVTVAHSWPAWVLEAVGLWLTEGGALVAERRARAGAAFEQAVVEWLDEVFAGASRSLPVGRLLHAVAFNRVFQPTLVAYPILRGLIAAFPGSTVHIAGDPGNEAQLLESLARGSDVQVVRNPPSPLPPSARVSWAARITATVALATAGAAAKQLQAFRSARPSLAEIARLRTKNVDRRPQTWVVLVPDWYRINHHLLDAYALPEVEESGSLGVLLLGPLHRGERSGAGSSSKLVGRELWAGLGRLRDHLDQCAVDQISMPETASDVVRTIVRAAGTSAKIAIRLASSRTVTLAGCEVDLEPIAMDLAKLATIEVMRIASVEHAVEAASRHHSLSGATVIFSTTVGSEQATASLALEEHRAVTVDHPHGSGEDNWTGYAQTQSTIRCVWTHADARAVAPGRDRIVVTGMPVRGNFVPRTGKPRRALILTNYVHDGSRVAGRFPRQPYQREALAIIEVLRAMGHSDLAFRWRPHPADVAGLVDAELARHDGVELSRGRSVEEDAEWADLVVTSVSTVVLEVLLAEVPVFVHCLPEVWGLPASDFIAPERLFFYANDGARLVSDCLRRAGEGPPDLGLERAARRALFGPTLMPQSMREHFGVRAAGNVSGTRRG